MERTRGFLKGDETAGIFLHDRGPCTCERPGCDKRLFTVGATIITGSGVLNQGALDEIRAILDEANIELRAESPSPVAWLASAQSMTDAIGAVIGL